MNLIVSSHDAHVSDVRLALAKEHHDRLNILQGMVGQGHVTIVQDENPATVTVQIDDELFSEPRDHFPTTVLMARLQLAVHAGKSDLYRMTREGSSAIDDHQADAMSYTMAGLKQHTSRAFRRGLPADVIYHTYGDSHIGEWDRKLPAADVTKRQRVTATVKPPKGLRP